jgi:hypothetical protein
MPITERTLRYWRREALKKRTQPIKPTPESLTTEVLFSIEMNERIIRLTQELLDIHLVNKE